MRVLSAERMFDGFAPSGNIIGEEVAGGDIYCYGVETFDHASSGKPFKCRGCTSHHHKDDWRLSQIKTKTES